MPDQLENIKITLQSPTTIRYNEEDESVLYYYKESKGREASERFLMVAVKYLNGEGFIITAFFTNKISGIKWKMK